VRAVEAIFALDEAVRLIEAYVPPVRPAAEISNRGGTGRGCTEAPRGLLYHRYACDAEGTILDAKIVPPTSQNQRTIEEDIACMGRELAELPLPEARTRAERAIRNYDPCISCATHFVDLRFESVR
jgi:coenzyme F420-reducing hydrogenase alpha subunit